MNRKGFTLMELIVTIALIGFVGIVLSINMVKVINNQDEKNKERVKLLVEETACAYAGLSTSNCDAGCEVAGTTLINEGLIEEEINGIAVKDYTVIVTYETGERICKVN